MHKLRLIIICMYSILYGKLHKLNYDSKIVIVLFFGRIGDGVMFLDALDEYKKMYSKDRGYRLIFGCRNEVRALLVTLNKNEGIEFIEIDRDRLLDSLKYYISKVKEIESIRAETIIHVRENNAVENVFIHASPAKEKIIYRSFAIDYSSSIKRFFSMHTFDKDYSSDETCDQLTNYARLLRILGEKEYQSKIPRIRVEDDIINELPNQYIVVSPGASSNSKCWPLDRYSEVLDCLSDYCKNIVICGSESDSKAADAIFSFMKKEVRIINKAGKTNIKQWIAIIQNAMLVISNESAAVHFAAATGAPCICIGEQTYGDMWLPYRPEHIRQNDKMPIVVRSKKMDCSFCVKREFRLSPECKACINQNGVKKCIYDITTQLVNETIKKTVMNCRSAGI